jgi:hypothetical protein
MTPPLNATSQRRSLTAAYSLDASSDRNTSGG